MKLSVALFLGCVLLQAQVKPPKLIDCHVHHNGQKAFLDHRAEAQRNIFAGTIWRILNPK